MHKLGGAPTPRMSLREQLQSSLGSTYTIERELGGGGMSRVYVAHEAQLGRKVVIKVLAPELAAAISAERFQREIRVAAQLQHPHIVPVLSAGEAAELPYYTMPYVQGDSLRDRVATAKGGLPVREVVDVMRQVALALDFAHRNNVVHRDIKPDNILLTGSSVAVTDFGIAKALNAARAQMPDGTLTQIGTAIGTPAYMSPEQASGDPDTDHRTDIYALGATAYELLCGESPFHGLPPHRMMAAHMSQEPPAIGTRRADVPPALAALVMRSLEKNPALRPQSARELVDALDSPDVRVITGPTVGAASGTVRRRGLLWTAVALVAVLAVVAVLVARNRPEVVADGSVVAIAPFRVAGADKSVSYLREGVLDLLSAKFAGLGTIRATDPRAMLSAWRGAGGTERDDPTEETLVRIARGLGAGRVIVGSVVGPPEKLVFNAQIIDVRGGARVNVTQTGPADSVPALMDRMIAVLLASDAGFNGEKAATLASVPLPVLRGYLDGQGAYRRARYGLAIEKYNAALAIDSTFVPAIFGLVSAGNWAQQPGFERSMHLLGLQKERLSERERALYDAWYETTFNGPRVSGDRMRAAWEHAAALNPDNPDVVFEAADVTFHGGFRTRAEAFAFSLAGFRRAVALDSTFAPAMEHLVDIAVIEGDLAEARRWMQRYLALDSLADHVDYMRWRLATAEGDTRTLVALRARLDSMSEGNLGRIIGTAQLDGVGVRDAERAAKVLRAPTPAARRDSIRWIASLLVNQGRYREAATLPNGWFTNPVLQLRLALVEGDTARGVRALEALRPLVRSRPASDTTDIARRYAAQCVSAMWLVNPGGESRARAEAAALLRELAATAVRAGVAGRSDNKTPYCVVVVEAMIAAVDKAPNARALVQRADSMSWLMSAEADSRLGVLIMPELWRAIGDDRQAMVASQRPVYHWNNGTLFHALVYRKQGEMAAAAGERELAIRSYEKYLALREHADPELQDAVAAVRREVARLKTARGER